MMTDILDITIGTRDLTVRELYAIQTFAWAEADDSLFESTVAALEGCSVAQQLCKRAVRQLQAEVEEAQEDAARIEWEGSSEAEHANRGGMHGTTL